MRKQLKKHLTFQIRQATKRRAFDLLIVAALGFLSIDIQQADASIETWEFSGRVTGISDKTLIPTLVEDGSSVFHGVFWFNTDAIDINDDPRIGDYAFTNSQLNLSLSIEGVHVSRPLERIFIFNDWPTRTGPTPFLDTIYAWEDGHPEGDVWNLLINEYSETASDFLTSDVLPTDPPDLGQIYDEPGNSRATFWLDIPGLSFAGELDSLQTAVPELTSLAIWSILGLVGAGLGYKCKRNSRRVRPGS